MENLFARHKPKRGMVCLMTAGSLMLHGGLVGIASLRNPPQPEEHSVPMDIFDGPAETPGPGRTLELPQQNPAETPEVTATPDVLEAVATPPPSDDPDFASPAEPTPPRQRAVAIDPRASALRPTVGQTTSRNSVGSTGVGTPGGISPAGVTGKWTMPHPPYPRILGRSTTGQTTVRITTDAAGRVSNVVIIKSTGNPALDNHTSNYVRNNWHGPPNASRTTEFIYEVR